jgi:asparagine synthase (glutamine-hydrolysing)
MEGLRQAAEALYALTKRTVRELMISDVPVGFLLSGGVDSTIVLSCAATETSKRSARSR